MCFTSGPQITQSKEMLFIQVGRPEAWGWILVSGKAHGAENRRNVCVWLCQGPSVSLLHLLCINTLGCVCVRVHVWVWGVRGEMEGFKAKKILPSGFGWDQTVFVHVYTSVCNEKFSCCVCVCARAGAHKSPVWAQMSACWTFVEKWPESVCHYYLTGRWREKQVVNKHIRMCTNRRTYTHTSACAHADTHMVQRSRTHSSRLEC